MKRIALILTLCFTILTACTENTEHDLSISDTEKIENKIESINDVSNDEHIKSPENYTIEEDVSDFLIQLLKVLTKKDYIKLRDYINNDKVYSITIFDDAREASQAVITLTEDITQDLILRSSYSDSGDMYLPLIFNHATLDDLQVNGDDELRERSITINWDSNDEAIICSEIPNLKQELRELILMNNKYIPQIFCLKDGFYAFSYSDLYVYNKEDFVRLGLEGSYDESKPLESFTGNWILFSDKGDEFKILAFINIQ